MSELISIIIPVYNSQNFILDCLNSCIQQRIPQGYELEILVIDDCSKDETVAIVQQYAKSVKTEIVVHEKNLNSGPAASRNIGLQLSSGKYIAFIDSDDLMQEDRLLDQLTQMESAETKVSFGGVTEINEEGNVIRKVIRPFPNAHKDVRKALVLDKIYALTSTFMIHREVYETVGLFDEQLIHFEDYDYFMRTFDHFECTYICRSLSAKRVFSNSLSFTLDVEGFIRSRSTFFKLICKRDPSWMKFKRQYWGRQYFGLGRLMQGQGSYFNSLKYYLKSFTHGYLLATLGIGSLLLPGNIKKQIANKKWGN